ncbi:hypothetical protein SprV_0100357300 [Sparganum proliferum]
MPNCKQCPKFLLFVLWIVLTGGILAIIGLFFISGNGRQAFAVIVDAGSTSSKISVITWRDWPFRTNEWVEEINYTIVEPGISAYAEDPEEASDRLVPVLQQVLSNHVPALESAKTSLYLAATAGMRLLDLNNPLKSAEIVESLRQTLPNIGAVVHNVFSDIRIISGSTEGRYGWVAANYLDRKLGDPSGLPPESGDKMSGMLDLGGASTQIAFVPEEGRPAPHISSINLFGATYDVYSYSFLCFGKEAFTRRYLARRIALTSNVSSDLPRTVTLVGTGQHTECREEVARLFPSKACSHNSCSFMNVSQPSPRGKFFAFSGFYYPIHFYKFPTGGSNLTRNQVHQAVDMFCQRNWSEVHDFFCQIGLRIILTYGLRNRQIIGSIRF